MSALAPTHRIAAFATAGALSLGLALSSAPTAAADETRSFVNCPLLVEGMSHPCVGQLQTKLNRVNASYRLTPDSRFGPGTRIAVLDFQGRNHLPADGNVGSITADELSRQAGADPGWPTSSRSPQGEGGATASDPNEECLRQGKIRSSRTGECVSDGVVPLGKPVGECIKDAAGKEFKKAFQDYLKKGKTKEEAEKAGQEAADKAQKELDRAAKKAAGKKLTFAALKEFAKKGGTIASFYKCMFWDKPGS